MAIVLQLIINPIIVDMKRERIFELILLFFILSHTCATPAEDLARTLNTLRSERELKGMQVQVSKQKEVIFDISLGQKNEAGDPVDKNTLFRIASVSKSFSSVAIMQLVEQKKISLNQTLSSIFGYKIVNPNFPDIEITVQMVLTHQSSLIQCDPYYSDFLTATYNAKSGSQVPNIREILVKGGKFYGDCLFSKTSPPGTHYQYVNLNYGIAGTIVEIVSNRRFDEYQKDNILTPLSEGLSQTATFNPANIKTPKNLGVIYVGDKGKWTPSYDNYPSGVIPQRNLTGYQIGTNGAIFGPQGGLRVSVSHLTNYAIMLANGGKTKQGKVIISPQSVAEIIKPRYQFHGAKSGSANDFHAYGLGIYTTTYRRNDIVISHQVARGHLGAAYGLISAQFFWKDYTMTYLISGALNGYKYGTGTIYQYERLAIHEAVQKFINASSMEIEYI